MKDFDPERLSLITLLTFQSLEVTLEGEAPSGPPKNVEARGLSSTSIKLTWERPEVFLTHGQILSYKILIKQEM